ncbi:hypothetical protein EON81_03010 [bacterium]|nr:MAG: hypothetical protein EON81_03010 [bacterium]
MSPAAVQRILAEIRSCKAEAIKERDRNFLHSRPGLLCDGMAYAYQIVIDRLSAEAESNGISNLPPLTP